MATNNADIGFEKQIWDAACVLRGNMDASEYKNVVLGLIFLKYISDRFEEKHRELVAEGDGFEEDIDEYTSEGIFFVPQGARWGDIAAKAHTPEIGTAIDEAMRAIEKTAPEGHSAEKLCPPGIGQAAPRRGGRPLHQHPHDRARRRKGHSRQNLRILPCQIRIAGGQTGGRILHAVLRGAHTGGSLATLSRTCV